MFGVRGLVNASEIAHLDTGNIGDGIVGPGLSDKEQTKLTAA